LCLVYESGRYLSQRDLSPQRQSVVLVVGNNCRVVLCFLGIPEAQDQACYESDEQYCRPADVGVVVVDVEDVSSPDGPCDAAQAHEGVAEPHRGSLADG